MNKKTLVLIIVMILVVIMGIILGCYIVNIKRTNEVLKELGDIDSIRDEVNLKELIEDINSIRDHDKIVNAKEKEPYSYPSTFYGDGYNIFVFLDKDYTEYTIYLNSNDKAIWRYTNFDISN